MTPLGQVLELRGLAEGTPTSQSERIEMALTVITAKLKADYSEDPGRYRSSAEGLGVLLLQFEQLVDAVKGGKAEHGLFRAVRLAAAVTRFIADLDPAVRVDA